MHFGWVLVVLAVSAEPCYQIKCLLHLGLLEHEQGLGEPGVQAPAHEAHLHAVLLDVAHRLLHARHVRVEFQLRGPGQTRDNSYVREKGTRCTRAV